MQSVAVLVFGLMSISIIYAGERGTMTKRLPLMEQGKTPEDKADELRGKRCLPCEGMAQPLSHDEEDAYAVATPHWQINRDNTHKMVRQFLFKNFKDSMRFVEKVADIAEEEQHHPTIQIFFNSVILELYTYAIGGLSENDFILAARVDEVAQKQRRGGRRK